MKYIKICVILFISYLIIALFSYSMMDLYSYSMIDRTQETLIEISPEKKAKIQTLWMQKSFNLDSSSTSIVYQINLEYQKRLDSLTSSSSFYASMISFQTKREQKLKESLSQQQFDDFIAWKKKIHENNKIKKIIKQYRI